MSGKTIRTATEADMVAIQRIYAGEVENGLATFEIEVPSVAEMTARLVRIEASGLPYLVAERSGAVLGFAYAGPYHERPAYRFTLEDSVYVSIGARSQGIGTALLERLIAASVRTPARQMLALIGDSANEGSIKLHEKAGFELVGTQRSVGFKHGCWLDVVIMQLPLNRGDATYPEMSS